MRRQTSIITLAAGLNAANKSLPTPTDEECSDAVNRHLAGGEMWHTTFDRELESIVLQLHNNGVPIAAICGTTGFLAQAGIFKKGIQHTRTSLEYLQQTVPG